MSLLVGEAAAYRLVLFIRQWASTQARWEETMSVSWTLDKTCGLVAERGTGPALPSSAV